MECSSLRVGSGGNVTIISHCEEISISGGVGEMARTSWPVFSFFFLFFFFFFPFIRVY